MEGLAPLLIIIISIVSALAKSKKNKVPVKRPTADAEKRLQDLQNYLSSTSLKQSEEKAGEKRPKTAEAMPSAAPAFASLSSFAESGFGKDEPP